MYSVEVIVMAWQKREGYFLLWQRNQTHHVASSLAEKSNPNTKAKQTPANQTQRCSSKPNTELFIKKKKKSPIRKPNPSKPNTEVLQQTKHRGVYQKKKKKSPIRKPKPNPSKPNPVTHDHVTVVVAAARSSSSSSLTRSPLIADCRSEIRDRRSLCLCSSARCSVVPPALPQGISLFFSLTLSQSLSLYLIEMKKWNESQIVDRSSICTSAAALVSGARCSLQQSGLPSRFFSLTLSQTLSLSRFISLNEKMKWNLWTSLSLYCLIAYMISVSLSLFWTVSLLLAGFCFFPVFVFLNLALSYPFLLVSVLVLVKYWLLFSVTCVVICDWHCEIFWLQLDIVIGSHVVLVCCLLSGVGRG